MKSIIDHRRLKHKIDNFPKLLIDKKENLVIIAYDHHINKSYYHGVVVYDRQGHFGIGYNSFSWDVDNFKVFLGNITLENDES